MENHNCLCPEGIQYIKKKNKFYINICVYGRVWFIKPFLNEQIIQLSKLNIKKTHRQTHMCIHPTVVKISRMRIKLTPLLQKDVVCACVCVCFVVCVCECCVACLCVCPGSTDTKTPGGCESDKTL